MFPDGLMLLNVATFMFIARFFFFSWSCSASKQRSYLRYYSAEGRRLATWMLKLFTYLHFIKSLDIFLGSGLCQTLWGTSTGSLTLWKTSWGSSPRGLMAWRLLWMTLNRADCPTGHYRGSRQTVWGLPCEHRWRVLSGGLRRGQHQSEWRGRGHRDHRNFTNAVVKIEVYYRLYFSESDDHF